MKDHFVEMLFAFDCGSEAERQSEGAVKAFKAFVGAQKKLDGEANLTGYSFHNEIIPFFENKPIAKIAAKDYRFETGNGQGECRMLDAVAQLMDDVGARLSATPEEERPSRVIVTISVFGRDNASKKCTYDRLAEMIAHQRDVYKWKFFLMTDFTINMEKLGIAPDDTIVLHKDDPDLFKTGYEELSARIAAIRAEC
ncbi:MAG: hypothetical protein NC084_05675 [Bacteroides sp.]|nr:hypothetical protein [Roseburia sp.]MCM1462187.1 hypothetical protein [Bacteroides sp.]